MMYFVEADVAEYCYVDEAALWLAFGDMPIAEIFEGKGDARRIGEMAETGETIGYHWRHNALSWIANGFEVDFRRYNAALEQCGGESSESLRRRIQGLEEGIAQTGGDVDGWIVKFLEEARVDLAAAEYVKEVEKPLRPFIEDARHEIYRALRDGRLTAQGWVQFTDEEEAAYNADPQQEEDYQIGVFHDIPKEAWIWQYFDWEMNKLVADEKEFKGVQINTESVLEMFPKPRLPKVFIGNVPVYGMTVIPEWGDNDDGAQGAETNAHFPMKSRPRGRPPTEAKMSIKDAVINFLIWQDQRGLLPDGKAEAEISFVQEFVRQTFRQELPRSTAQLYVKEMETRRGRETASNSNTVLLNAPVAKGL